MWSKPLQELKGEEGVDKHNTQETRCLQALKEKAFLGEVLVRSVFSGEHFRF